MDIKSTSSNKESSAHTTSLFWQYLKIAGAVALYWFCSITMVFLNKHLLSSEELKNVPLFITWYQCLTSVILCFFLDQFSRCVPTIVKFPKFEIRSDLCYKIVMLSIMFVCMITFNNLCLKFVGVSFYFVGRSLSTVFNVICTYIILNQITSLKSIICCAVIIFGFCFGVDQENLAGSLSVTGVIFGVLASLTVALNAIHTKKALPVVSDDIWKLTLYNNVNASLLFIPLMLVFGELSFVLQLPLSSLYFWLLMTFSGFLGFAMSYVTGLQIQVTSPLTHNISGTAKAAAQTVLAVIWFSESKSFLWWFSNGIVLFGSAAYTYVRQQEMAKKGSAMMITMKYADREPLVSVVSNNNSEKRSI